MQYKFVVEDDDGTVTTREFRAITRLEVYEHFDSFMRGAGFIIPYGDEDNYETDQSWEPPVPDEDPKDLDWPFPKKFVADEVNTWQTANT